MGLLLLAPVRLLWLLAPILLAPIVVLLAPFAALSLRLILPTFTSTLILIVECVACRLHSSCVALYQWIVPSSQCVHVEVHLWFLFTPTPSRGAVVSDAPALNAVGE